MLSQVKKIFTVLLFAMFFCCAYTAAALDNEKIIDLQHQDSLLPINSTQLLDLIEESESALTLLNFWATWCDPCVEEFPDLVTLSKNHNPTELRVIFVSTDFERSLPSVRQFLDKQNLDLVSYYKSESDNTFINAMNPNWSGALPATFVYDNAGNKLEFWIGSRTLEELETIINKHLNANNKGK